MTEKLYYIDSHMARFDAKVTDCRRTEGGWSIVLNRTAFFPGGGGQSPDTGYIGEVPVLNVREKGGEIVHICEGPLEPGTEYSCRIDFEKRFRRMQNHSGEHIFSGLTHMLYGYENVGFHMGDDCLTLDFSGELGEDDIVHLETLANRAVWSNVPVTARFPEPAELQTMEYRSKLELTEDVRIVTVEGIDICACCAPHVSFTGEVGLIKVLDWQRHRGGMRISLICGQDALERMGQYQRSVTAVSRALSVKRHAVADAVERVLCEQQRQKERNDALGMELVRFRAHSAGETKGNILLFEEFMDDTAQRELVNLLVDKCGGLACVFVGSDETGWRYVIGSISVNLREKGSEINFLISGKGGGTAQMIQGRAAKTAAEIQKNIEQTFI